jgi:replicative DNA helicase
MAQKIDRQLPYDINAEAAVLSAMMIDNYVVSKAFNMLQVDHFYRRAHQTIYKAMMSLYDQNIEIDLITLLDKLREMNTLDAVGGENFINDLSDMVMTAANMEYHATIVLQKALLRQLVQSCTEIIENCYNSNQPVDDIVDAAEQSIFRIAERPGTKTFVGLKDIIPDTIQNIEDIATAKKSIIGVPSGFRDLDKKIGGFRPGQLIIIAARPAMGKSAFALNIALNSAWMHDKKVGVFTMEMESEECLLRMLSAASGMRDLSSAVSMETMIKGYGMDQRKILTITGLAEALSEKDIYIDDSGSNTALDVRAKCRRLKAEISGLDMIIIDYLQLMSAGRNRDSRQQEISEISRAMKIMAKELNIPVLALSQLNRSLENREDKRPKLADLRESGAIEQDADIVMFIYRDEVYNPSTPDKPNPKEGTAEVIIGKNRHGSIGKVELTIVKECTLFKDSYYE